MNDDNKGKSEHIHVTVDNQQTQILAEELAREKRKREKLMDAIANKELDNDSIAEKKLELYRQTNDERYLDCKTKREITDLSLNLMAETVERKNPKPEAPSGSAPLNSSQMGEKSYSLYEKPYNRETLDELQKLSAEGDETAKTILTELLQKWAKSKHFNLNTPDGTFSPNKEDLDLVQKDGFLTPANRENGDLGRLQRKWRAELKKQMEGKQQ